MNITLKKTAVGSLVALTALASLAAVPAQAKPFPKWGGGYHHGFGGWGAAGLVGGLALGAIAVSAASNYYACGTIRQAVVDPYGVIVGYRYVPAC